MKKTFSLFNLFVILFEAFEILFVYTIKVESTIDLLPASWFFAIPLLVFPIVFILLLKESPKVFSFLYFLTKIMQNLGIIAYIIQAFPFAVTFGLENEYYSLRKILFLVLFLVVNVIISVIVLNKNKSDEQSNTQIDLAKDKNN